MQRKNWIKYGIGFLFAGAAMITLMGFATMWLWNWLIPELFNGSTVTFWQAIGLIALGKLLTGFMGMGRHGWSKHKHGGWNHEKAKYWKQRMDEKMSSLSEEEREKFKRYYYDRCGWKTKANEAENKSAEAQQ